MTKERFVNLDVYLADLPHSAAMNMAIDEALLERATVPSIRFYCWQSPALSFGYFGRFADVANYAGERDLVRRWTGGGIVFHGDDLTYSLVIPSNDPAFSGTSISIYEEIHRALRSALTAGGCVAELANVESLDPRRGIWGANAPRVQISAPSPKSLPKFATARARSPTREGASAPEICFANPVHADVMVNDRKIAGAAQRRTQRGLLQQGSIQGVDLGDRLAERFAHSLSPNCSQREIGDMILNRARELAQAKYGTDSWLRKR